MSADDLLINFLTEIIRILVMLGIVVFVCGSREFYVKTTRNSKRKKKDKDENNTTKNVSNNLSIDQKQYNKEKETLGFRKQYHEKDKVVEIKICSCGCRCTPVTLVENEEELKKIRKELLEKIDYVLKIASSGDKEESKCKE